MTKEDESWLALLETRGWFVEGNHAYLPGVSLYIQDFSEVFLPSKLPWGDYAKRDTAVYVVVAGGRVIATFSFLVNAAQWAEDYCVRISSASNSDATFNEVTKH